MPRKGQVAEVGIFSNLSILSAGGVEDGPQPGLSATETLSTQRGRSARNPNATAKPRRTRRQTRRG
jgi:hypothetical protein